jgi:RND family efflux transporter MFP subunit
MNAHRATLPLAILLAISCVLSCRKKSEPVAAQPMPAARVRVQAIVLQSRPEFEEVVGTVRAKLHAAIEAKVSGRIEKMVVVPGQIVKAGDLLVQLDTRETQARLDQSIALREQFARDAERLRQLLKENAVSRQEFETVDSRYRVAAASAIEAETMLGYARIAAPFDGVVTRKMADVGDLAAPGRALLEIDDPKALRLETDIPEALLQRVSLGAKLDVRCPGQDDPIAGLVSEIAPVADPASRTVSVKLDLPANAGLHAGQFARVTVPLGERQSLWVPASAVVQRGQMELLFVRVSNQAQLRLVKTGKRFGSDLELVSGLNAGEQVIIEGAGQLRDGQPLNVEP